jgi:hypothetical protein
LANRPSAKFANSSYKNNLQAKRTGSALSASQGRVLVAQVSRPGVLRAKSAIAFSATICSMQENKKITTDNLFTRTKFKWFLSKALRSSFKKLIISTPFLIQGLGVSLSAPNQRYSTIKEEEGVNSDLRRSDY